MADKEQKPKTDDKSGGPTPEQKPESKISVIYLIILVFVALFFDMVNAFLNLIPFIGNALAFFVNIFAYATFAFLYIIKGISLFRGRNLLVNSIAGASGLIPLIGLLPAWTASVFLMYFNEKTSGTALAKVPVASAGK